MSRRHPRRWVRPDRRNRTRSQHWWSEHNHGLLVDCVGRPRGCDAKAGDTCIAIDGEPLVNQPCHPARLTRAQTLHPTTLPLTTTTEETP